MKKLATHALILLCVVFLIGCNDPLDHIAQPSAVPISSPLNEVVQFAVAIDTTGVKHIVSIECPVGTFENCKMVYRTYPASSTHTYTPASGFSYFAPDITVDSSGQAYIIVNKVTDSLPHTAQTAWVKPGITSLNFITTIYATAGLPNVAANGAYVYAVWEVVDGEGSALRYRQLNILDDTGGWVSEHPANARHRSQAAAAVSSTGKLHVTWREWPDESTQAIYYNSNTATSGDMNHLKIIQTASGLGPPAIAVDHTNTHVYVTYAKTIGISKEVEIASNDIRLWTCATNCTDAGTVINMLDTSLGWWLCSSPSIAASHTEDKVYIAFCSVNDDVTLGKEIFRSSYQASNGYKETTRITWDNSDEDSFPQIVSVVDSQGLLNIPVIGWRKKINASTYGNVWVYDTNTPPRLVATSNSGAAGFEMAANGSYMIGAWLGDINPYLESSHTVWFSYNDAAVFLPLIQR